MSRYSSYRSPYLESSGVSSSSTGAGGYEYSVYLGSEDKASPAKSSAKPSETPRSYRSASVSIEPVSNISESAADTVRSRFNRTLSIYDDEQSASEKSSQNGVSDRYSRYNSSRTYSTKRDEDKDKEEKSYTNGYINGSYNRRESIAKETSPPLSLSGSRFTSGRTYYTKKEEENEDEEKPYRNGYRRRESIAKDPSPPPQKTYGGYSLAADDPDSEGVGGYSSIASRYRSRQNNRYTAEAEEDDESDSSGSGAAGLRNIGNTCFMNSVIQCLGSTKLLMSYLLKDSYTSDINTSNSAMKGSLVKAFATVIKSLWKGGGRIVDPSSLKGAINRFAPRFSGYNQEDSQEFLRYLLEGLHEDVNRVLTKPQPINTEIDSSLSVCEQAMEAWKRYLRRDNSYLVDLFVGQLKSTLKCRECGYESVTFEAFWDISLPIPSKTGEVSLLDCFDSFTREELLSGDEMPTCEQCKARRECSKRYSLYKLPKVLVIHLKRFSPTERYRQKLSTVVRFPLTGLSLPCDSSLSSTHYDCYAVSNHSGTLYSGHYTAYAKSPQSGQWYSYNDSRVSKCSSSSVMSNENYLLFFEMS